MATLYLVSLIALAVLVYLGIKYPTILLANRIKYIILHLAICLILDHFKPGAFLPFCIIGFIPYIMAHFTKTSIEEL